MERSRFIGRLLLCLLLLPCIGRAGQVEALFDLSDWRTSPFPSDRFSVLDFRNLTFRRVDLPAPDCVQRVTDCQEVAILNTLDGFNLQPRLRIPFSGPIDPSTVNSSNLYIVKLGDTTRPLSGFGKVIGINQIVWDPQTNTLSAESDELLDQHSVYVFIMTTDVRDAEGNPLKTGRLLRPQSQPHDSHEVLYRASLLTALVAAKAPPGRIAAASVFTTRSTTAVLEKIRDQIKAATPAAADFAIANDGSRVVLPLSAQPLLVASRETAPGVFATQNVPLQLLNTFIPGAVSAVAMGRFNSPSYLTPMRYLPSVPTRTGVPAVQGEHAIYFNLVVPAGAKPVDGWPVAILGHGLPGDKDIPVLTMTAALAARGIATLTINAVGNGGGPQGTIRILRTNGPPLIVPAGGRASDPAGAGSYEAIRDVAAPAPYTSVSHTDSLRQTAIDLMQLVRLIETGGVDYDADGAADLDSQRIYYFGHSWGAIYGPLFVAVEPSIRAAVFNSGGGPVGIAAQLSPISRSAASAALGARIPSLLNALPVAPPTWGFNSNMPLRNQPPVINDVPGAIEIQEASEIGEWVQQGGAPVAYAPHLRKRPLAGNEPKAVIVQFGLGDLNVPNPVTTNFIRAGELSDVSTYFRTDLAFALDSTVPKNPHAVLNSAFIGPLSMRAYGRALQDQIATLFASDGLAVVDPDGATPIFEMPIAEPLPEELNFLP